MTWQVLNIMYDPIAQRYARSFLQENTIAGDTSQALRASLENRLTSGDIHRRYNILDTAVATEYGIAAANVPAQESRGRRFLQSFNPLRAYNFFNENDKQQVTRALAETRRQYNALNPAEADVITYLAPQEVGNVVDRLVESKTARAAARQIAIDAGYTAALNDEGQRYAEERRRAPVVAPNREPQLGEDRVEQPEEDDTIIGPRPSPPRDVPLPLVDERPKLHALDCRSGSQNFESWEYSDLYNAARSVKPGETVKTLVRDAAILGSVFATGGASAATAGAAALAWGTYKATSAVVGAGMQVTRNYAQRYIEDRDASHALGATAGVWAMYGINVGKEAAKCETVEGMGAYLGTIAALVTGSEATNYISKKVDNRFVKGTATAVSGALDWALLAVLGFDRPTGTVKEGNCGFGGSGNDTEKPSIDKIEYSTKTDLCKGDKAEFSFAAADNKDVEKVVAELYTAGDAQDALQAKLLGVPSPVTALQDATVHQDGITDINVFGKDVVEGNGSFTINDSGDYKILLTATDAAGNSTSQLVEHTYTIGNCESTVDPDEPPVCPVDPDEPKTPSALEDCVKERFSYGKDIKGVELREVYDYHTTPLKPEAGHEQGLTLDHWKGGSVSLNGVYDEHTPCDFNVDNTVVMLEHYTDAKALDYRVLVDVDASGHFEIPKEFAAYNGDDIQVTWAEVTHCEDGKLGLEDLASYTHGNHVVIPKEAVFEGSVPTHVAPHYVDCDGSADATPAPKHTDVPKDDCGPCKTACDKEYYVPVGVVDTKAGPCPDGAPVMTSSGFVPAGTLDTVVNTFGYMPSDVSGTPVDAVPGSVDATLNPFGYTPDAAAPLSAPGGTLDATPNPFDGVAPAVPGSIGAPSGTLSDPVDPFDVDAGSAPADPLVYNLGHYYQETYYIDDEVLRAFERQQQAALELRLV